MPGVRKPLRRRRRVTAINPNPRSVNEAGSGIVGLVAFTVVAPVELRLSSVVAVVAMKNVNICVSENGVTLANPAKGFVQALDPIVPPGDVMTHGPFAVIPG